jgi:hypothetical protein
MGYACITMASACKTIVLHSNNRAKGWYASSSLALSVRLMTALQVLQGHCENFTTKLPLTTHNDKTKAREREKNVGS